MGMASMGGMSGFNLYSFAVATLGAIVLIAVVQAVRHA
jgi:uncharacterized membrane protein YeaQ/YmgE (transglycosylase-associated protein family)